MHNPYWDTHWYPKEQRHTVWIWWHDSLSEQNRKYRMDALCYVFKLPFEYIIEWICGTTSMGTYLAEEVLIWIFENWDLNPNNPIKSESQWTNFHVES